MKNPLISIFIPVYNGERYLHRTLHSILNQTYTNFEIVCVDDSSNDNSYGILLDYQSRDSRIVVFQKKNGGNVPKSLNFAIPKLKGDFFLYMSQDDEISSDFLFLGIEMFRKTNCDVLIPTCQFVAEKNPPKPISLDRNTIISGKEAFILSLKSQMHGFNLVKTDLIKNERCNETIYCSDEFFAKRILYKAERCASFNGIFSYHIDNPRAITKSPQFYRLQILSNNLDIYEFIERHKDLPNTAKKNWSFFMISTLFWAKSYIKENKQFWGENEKRLAMKIYNASFRNVISKQFINKYMYFI